MNAIEAWWLDRLAAGAPLSRLDGWPDCVPTRGLMADYVAHADRTGIHRKSTETQFGIAIQRLVPGIVRTRETVKEFDAAGNVMEVRQQRVYRLPTLELCRSFFAEKLNGHTPWEREIE